MLLCSGYILFPREARRLCVSHPAGRAPEGHGDPRRARSKGGVPAPLFTDVSVGSTTSLARVPVGREDTRPHPLPKPAVRPAAPPPATFQPRSPSSPSSLGPCSPSASPLGDLRTCNPLRRAGPPARARVWTRAPHSRRAPESSGARGYTGRTTDPLGQLAPRKGKPPRRLFLARVILDTGAHTGFSCLVTQITTPVASSFCERESPF